VRPSSNVFCDAVVSGWPWSVPYPVARIGLKGSLLGPLIGQRAGQLTGHIVPPTHMYDTGRKNLRICLSLVELCQ
jgi:hypothetical protein